MFGNFNAAPKWRILRLRNVWQLYRCAQMAHINVARLCVKFIHKLILNRHSDSKSLQLEV